MDILGHRMLFGVVTPSTNTVVQPEYDDMRPPGVTNHISRMVVPNSPIETDEDFGKFVQLVDDALDDAVDGVLTCLPQHLVLGISAESVWGGGLEPSIRIRERIRSRSPYPIEVTQAADALPEALAAVGAAGSQIAVLTPYATGAEPHLRSFFEAIGADAVRMTHLARPTPIEIAHTEPALIREAASALDGPDIAAIVQFGANLPVAGLVEDLERRLGKPFICVNVATYWWALRRNGIADRLAGFGRLLAEH